MYLAGLRPPEPLNLGQADCGLPAEGWVDALTADEAASPLAARPYDLRHGAASLWLSAGVPPTEVARRLGHGAGVLLKVYACPDLRRSEPVGVVWHTGAGCGAGCRRRCALQVRRARLVADGGGLENRFRGNPDVGSNPTPSARPTLWRVDPWVHYYAVGHDRHRGHQRRRAGHRRS